MKNLNVTIFSLVLITGLTVSSCSKKSNDPSPTDNMVGTWTASTSTVSTMVGTKTLTQYLIDVMKLTTADAQLYTTIINESIKQGFTGTITVKADNTYTTNLGGEADSGTWILSADGKKLTIDSKSDVPVIFDVTELTAKSLKLKIVENESDDLNGDGIPESLTVTAEISFTK
jgi:hypothetical protein